MFEKIHLAEIRFDKPYTNIEIPVDFNPLYLPLDADDVRNMTRRHNIRNYMHGSIKCLLCMPYIEQHRTDNIYFHSFNVVNAEPDFYRSQSDMDIYVIIASYSGKGIVRNGDKTYKCGEGDICIVNSKELVEYYPDHSKWQFAVITLSGRLPEDYFSVLMESNENFFHLADMSIFQIQLENLLADYITPSVHHELYFSNSISNFLTLIVKCADSDYRVKIPEEINYLLGYISKHYREHITIDDMAEISILSKYHLSRQFKRYIGTSPMEYVIRLRVEEAKLRLRLSDMPVCQICEECGFGTEANFIRLFQKNVGTTPGQYRAYK